MAPDVTLGAFVFIHRARCRFSDDVAVLSIPRIEARVCQRLTASISSRRARAAGYSSSDCICQAGSAFLVLLFLCIFPAPVHCSCGWKHAAKVLSEGFVGRSARLLS